MKSTRWYAAAFGALFCFTLAGVTAGPVRSGDLDGVYIVRPGDSLSAIAGEQLGDIGRWREILEANPQVTDPNRIYPGDTLQIPGKGAADAMAGLPDEGTAAAGAAAEPPAAEPMPSPGEAVAALRPPEPPVPALPVEEVLPPQTVNAGLYRSAGYISRQLPEASVLASVEDRLTMGEGDSIVISTPAGEGDLFTVIRPVRRVLHPLTGEDLGWLIKIMGTAEVTCPGEKTATAVLTGSFDAVMVGDLLKPADPGDGLDDSTLGPKQGPVCIEPRENDGIIVTVEDELEIFGEGNIVFIDRGTAHGVTAGEHFIIYRPVTGETHAFLGEAKVLRAGEETSTVLVTNSLKDLMVADLVQPQ